MPHSLSPILATQKYLKRRTALKPNSSQHPLLLIRNGKALARAIMMEILRTLLASLGYTATHYSEYSFRIGATTSAAKAGVPIYLIKILGRWSSQAYYRYIRTSASCIIRALTTITAV